MRIGYARVSTDEQDTRLQLDALKRAGCKRIYHEEASGAKADRPELARALDSARAGDILIVWKLDRLARSLRQLIDTMDLLAERGVEFRSLTEEINTATAGGKLTFHIFAALAEFERALIRERTMAGLAAARARGRKGGPKPKLKPEQIEKARTLANARAGDGGYRHTMGSIAREFGVSKMTLWRALKRVPAEQTGRGRVAPPRTRPQASKRSRPVRKKRH